MINKYAEKWCQALESGKYEQGKGALNKDGKFCCLGVPCELFQTECCLEIGVNDNDCTTYNEVWDNLPRSLANLLGLQTVNGGFDSKVINVEDGVEERAGSLIDLNDDYTWSFKEIAAFIRSEPAGLFIEQTVKN